uniref:RING-type E3 ubiquitin transferase n=2 Tax=Quercus lobata TaxID=97700 RepID=A0A7N2MRD1_QUELO
MPVVDETTGLEQVKWRRPRNQFQHQPISEMDPPTSPNPQIPSIIQSSRCKSTISSLLLSTFSNTNSTNEATPTNANTKKKNNFTSATFRGLGCTASASQQVSVPAVIRGSADWEAKKSRKKKKKQKKNFNNNSSNNNGNNSNGNNGEDGPNIMSCVDVQDVWCGPGIGFSAEDCVVARRNGNGRGKIDGDTKINHTHRERPCLGRRAVNPEPISFLDSDSDYVSSRPGLEVFGTRYYRHARHPSPEGFAEIMMLQNSLLMGGRIDTHDRYRDLRLDVDSMSYEELLELGDRIGYVSTGLKEEEISRCLRNIKHSLVNDLSPHFTKQVDRKCSICQEEYEGDDEMGKLDCGHSYHLQCIKQWLAQKNCCPVCKTEVVARC